MPKDSILVFCRLTHCLVSIDTLYLVSIDTLSRLLKSIILILFTMLLMIMGFFLFVFFFFFLFLALYTSAVLFLFFFFFCLVLPALRAELVWQKWYWLNLYVFHWFAIVEIIFSQSLPWFLQYLLTKQTQHFTFKFSPLDCFPFSLFPHDCLPLN